MPADAGRQADIGSGWSGPDPRHGDGGQPLAGRSGGERWAPAEGSGYGQGRPQNAYRYEARDSAATADAWRQDDYGRYGAGGPVSREQRDGYDRHDSGARSDPPDRQRDAAVKPARRIGPPAALPPGPSASRAEPAEPEAAATSAEAARAAHGADDEHARPGQAPAQAGSAGPDRETAAEGGSADAGIDGDTTRRPAADYRPARTGHQVACRRVAAAQPAA